MASDVSMRVYRNNETTKGAPPLTLMQESCQVLFYRSGTNVALGPEVARMLH